MHSAVWQHGSEGSKFCFAYGKQPFKGARKKCNEIVLSMCTGHVWQHGSESVQFCFACGGYCTSHVVNQACVYVCSGRASGNERRLVFYARYEET